MKKFSVICLAVILIGTVTPVGADICNLSLDYDTGWPWPGNQRWKDVAGNMYEGTPDMTASSADYAGASVSVSYDVVGSQLTGTVTATGLKPNFAYQLKLEGSSDAWTNTTLADLGRTSGTTGYLPFGMLVTDGSGNATTSFVTDSSYHVLFRTSDSTGTTGTYGFGMPAAYDGPITYVTFNPDPASEWYATDYGPATVGIYAQSELYTTPGKAKPGELVLPDGDYICKFVLTEESFHDTSGTFHPGWGIWSGAPAGSWASPFKGEISFTVPAPVPVPGAVVLGTIGIGYANWRLRRRRLG
ncbi:MAG: hypothetical protein KBE65_13190 [Phycisphaerae bacterium]|nr:hypothetical protein [Phycisphaerae bacterium]